MKKENLHNITSTGFKAPDNYFETFEAQFLERLDEKVIISAKTTSGFTVHNDYFDAVENTILEQLASTKPASVTKADKSVIVLKPRRTLYYVAGIAASFVLLFSLIFKTNDQLNINTIDTASIESYLSQQDYTNDDLANLLITDEISETDFIDINISDDTLNEYLESTDTEDFILD